MSWGPHKNSQRCREAFSLPLSLYVWSLSLNCNRLSIWFDDHVALFQDELQATYTIAESKKSPSSTRELRRVRDKEKNQSQIQPQAKLSKLQGETRNDDRRPTTDADVAVAVAVDLSTLPLQQGETEQTTKATSLCGLWRRRWRWFIPG